MEHPNTWIKAKEGETNQNLKNNIKLEEQTLKELVEQNKGTIQVVSFFKYPIETTAGAIPTIKVNLRNNPYKNFADFKKGIDKSFMAIKEIFPDFKYTSQPQESVVDGKKCVTASCIYTITSKNGSEKVKIIAYSIPVKNYFYQVTLMDTEKDNNEDLFEKIITTIIIQ